MYRVINQTSLTPFCICLGTSNMGSTVDRATSFAMLDAYVGAGGNFLDTASVYANWIPGPKHTSEKTLGAWMQARKNRKQIIVATKGGHPDLNTMHVPRLSPPEIASDLETSLRNLQTDHIDLYYLHRDDPARPVSEIMDTLNAQVKAGKIRYTACSNWRRERIAAANDYAQARGIQGFVANQMLWNLAKIEPAQIGDRTIVPMTADLYAYHQETGLTAIPFSSQANGLFQKLDAGEQERMNPGALAMYNLDETKRRLSRIKNLQTETGLSLTQIVIAYLTSQPFTTIPIVGCKTPAHLADSLSAVGVQLSAAHIHTLTGD
ncbi:MAG: aldo/keto reductase [Anaerolineae bacterium]|nr:aldo/keto reductase [Anaerolineae bacterium]